MMHQMLLDEGVLAHRFSSDGVGYYYRAGAGATAVLFIHGMGGSSNNWRLVVPLLPPCTPLVIVDLPWCATSRRYRGSREPEALVDAIAGCVSEVWTGPVVIVAHSIAGFFAWRFEDQRQVTVSGLVLISAHLFAVGDILRIPFSLVALPLRLSLADALLLSLLRPARFLRVAVNRSAAARRVLMWPMLNPALVEADAQVGECFRGNGGIGGLRMISRARKVDLLNVAQGSSRPTSVVFGTKDPLLTHGDHALIGDLGNVTSICQIDGARHFPMIEMPSAVASAIIEQLDR